MRFVNFLAVTDVLSLVLAAQGHAQDLMVYQAQGQSQEQQQGDEFECYNWSKQQSGSLLGISLCLQDVLFSRQSLF